MSVFHKPSCTSLKYLKNVFFACFSFHEFPYSETSELYGQEENEYIKLMIQSCLHSDTNFYYQLINGDQVENIIFYLLDSSLNNLGSFEDKDRVSLLFTLYLFFLDLHLVDLTTTKQLECYILFILKYFEDRGESLSCSNAVRRLLKHINEE